MKNFKLLLAGSILLGSSNLTKAQVATKAPYEAQYISVNQAGSVWAFGTGAEHGPGLYFDFNGWQFIKYDISNKVIAASSQYGKIVIANNDGTISEWNSNNKKWLDYVGLSDVKDVFISKKNSNEIFALGIFKTYGAPDQMGLYKVSNIATKSNVWEKVLLDANSATFLKATNDKNGNFYFVSSSGKVYASYSKDSRYKIIDTQGKFAVDVLIGEDNELYYKEKAGTIYKLNKTSNTWTPVNFSANSFGVDDKGNVYGEINKEIKALKAGQFSTITVENPNKLDGNGNTPLSAAVVLNDEAATKTVLLTGACPNIPNGRNEYPVTIAAKNGNTNIIKLLASNEANLDLKDRDGHTALHYAVMSGDKELVQTLLTNKANPDAEGVVATAVKIQNKELILLLSAYNADLTPGLSQAVEMNNAQMFTTLINYGAKLTNNKPFELAVDRNNKSIATTCLDNGADKNKALDYTLSKNNREIIGICLQKGASPVSAITYVLKNNDVTLTTELISKYGVKSDMVLARALPGSDKSMKASTGSVETINLKIAEVALQNGADANSKVDFATEKKNSALIELLLKYGADANKVLKAAVVNNDKVNAEKAILKGAQPILDNTLLQHALDKDNTEIADLLIDNGSAIMEPKLIKTAVEKNNEKIALKLLNKGAPTSDNSLIITAVTKGNANIVKALLDKGADPNAGLKMAIDNNKTNMAIMMLDKGADGSPAGLISKAVINGNKTLVSKLLDNGAKADNGMKAAIRGNKEGLFNLLIERGAQATNAEYVLATVKNNRIAMFKKLLEYGAKTDYVNASNENLLHFACRNSSYPIAQILVQRGVNVNQKSGIGRTPLHVAADAGRNNVDLCKLLVDAGADVNARDNRGKSVLKVADGKKLKDYLKSKGASK